MSKKYQLYRDVAGKYRFRLLAENNKIVAVGQAYEQHESCLKGIHSIQANCDVDIDDLTTEGPRLANPKYEIFYDKACGFRFHLKAKNGEIIAASEGYERKEGCLNGVNAVKHSCDAEIEDLTRTQKPQEEPQKEEIVDYAAIAQACTDDRLAHPDGVNQTALTLESPPTAKQHDVVVFQGKLSKSCSGEGIGDVKIEVWERDRSLLGDDYLAFGNTAQDGSFKIEWKARPLAWFDNTAKIYARFRGNTEVAPSVSELQTIVVE